MEWDVQQIRKSGIDNMDISNLEFGMLFTDHMIECDYENGAWQKISIKPVEALSLHPATHVFHYGQAVFEGLKAYQTVDGKSNVFRIRDNLNRLNNSLERMAMPVLDVDLVRKAMLHWLEMDRAWIPGRDHGSLYIRPFVISTSHMLRAIPSTEYKFMVIAGPVGFYYSKPIRVKLEREFSRASKGGVGFAKAAGNYGAAFMPSMRARKEGFDQLIWTDRSPESYIEELGSANIFLVIDDVFYTPQLHDSILAGITRDSILKIMKDLDIRCRETMISSDFLLEALESGKLQSVFACGTAAAITYINEIEMDGRLYKIDSDSYAKVEVIRSSLFGIRFNEKEDLHSWNTIF